MNIDTRKGIIGIIPIIIIFLMTLGTGAVLYVTSDEVPTPDSYGSGLCTLDLKQCSDGSYVGRIGSQCQFATCPDGSIYPPPGDGSGGGSGTTYKACTSNSQCSSSQTCVAIEATGTVEPGGGSSSFTITRGECKMKVGFRCSQSEDCGEGVCSSGTCTLPVGRQCNGPNDMTCGGGYQCVQGCGWPVPYPDEPPPLYYCQLKGYERPCPICLAENTHIATPSGEIAVQDLRQGMAVWTQEASGARVAMEILKVSRTPVPSTHQMVHLVLEDGRELLVSPRHPTTDGRTSGDLKSGDMLDGSRVVTAELVSYEKGFTYDLLPAGDTGFYWADGILIGSTLK